MILLEIWLAASLVLGACWAIVGLLIGEPTLEGQADGEAA